MNRREIVLASLDHQHTATIPYHLEYTAAALGKLIDYTGSKNIEDELGSFLHYTQYWGWPTEIEGRAGHFRDEFGVVWNRSGVDKDIGVVDEPLIKDLAAREYVFPVADEARLRRDLESLVATKGDRFTMMGFGFCMYERSWSLMGVENVLMSMLISPDETERLYDDICSYFLRLVDIALEYDIDGVYFGDDWGQQRGLIMGPVCWRRFIKPRMAKLYSRVKSAGKYVVQHSCGDCHEIMPDLIEIGLDCYQTFQPEVYDIAEMKRLYGDQLTFWGGVSTQQVLPNMPPAGIQDEIVRIVNIMRGNGGLIIAPTHAITHDIPPENILAMAEVFRNQSRYF
jgi:uroporphyrinogen decarboxylase